MKTINIIRLKNTFLAISGILVLAAVICIAFYGFRESIDFSGGTLWRFQLNDPSVSLDNVSGIFAKELSLPDVRLNKDLTDQSTLARLPVTDEATHQKAVLAFKGHYPGFVELSFESIGPSIGAEVRQNAIIAVILVLVGISVYVAFAFRKVSRPVSSWKYGLVTLVTLFHDVLIPAGMLALLGHLIGLEIDTNFVVALLVVAGFSVHDTIVVFDRIRENLGLRRGRSEFGEIVNDSINQTLARSINTSFTLIIVLCALLILGPSTLRYFIATLLLGTTVGTYSSIFVASPLLYLWQSFSKKTK